MEATAQSGPSTWSSTESQLESSQVRDAENRVTAGQRGLFLWQSAHPQSPAYHAAFAARVRRGLVPERLENALATVVARHDNLRSTFVAKADDVERRIVDARPGFEVQQAQGWSEEQLSQAVATAYARPFDLAAGPLVRLHLFCVAPSDYVLLIVVHHLVTDGWSHLLFLEELGHTYAGGAKPPGVVEATFSDFVSFQEDLLASAEGDKLLSFWRGELGGSAEASPALAQPRPARAAPERLSLELEPELTAELRRLAERCGATLYMVLLTALHVLVQRQTGRRQVRIASPVTGRGQPEFARVLGYFTNLVVVRSVFSGTESFCDAVREVKDRVLLALAYQDLPYTRLVEDLRVGTGNGAALFDLSFVFQSAPKYRGLLELLIGDGVGKNHDWAGLSLEPYPLVQQEGQFPITLELVELADSLRGFLKFDPGSLPRAEAEALLGRLRTLLRSAVTEPERAVCRLPLMTPAEQARELDASLGERLHLEPHTVPELVRHQARRHPHRIALAFEGAALTYAELERRTDRLAAHLIQQGVGPERFVGVCLYRSFDLIIALLAVLKAGGAYVALDPDLPEARFRSMLESFPAAPVITLTAIQERLELGEQAICLDTLELPASPPVALRARPENAAYAIFTSGSTGKPKAVVNVHAALGNRLAWMQARYRLSERDSVLQKTPFSFDVSVWEFFWPLITGARLVIARPGGHRDSAYLAGLIASEQISTLHFVPSMLRVFLLEPDCQSLVSVRQTFCSGEALGTDAVTRYLQDMPGKLHNLYGPTEAAIDVTAWDCSEKPDCATVPIGRPIANVETPVLDSWGNVLPPGVSGELYLGGVALARGYFARPDLTADRFLPHPFANGARLYRTGDRVRLTPSHLLEFQGRLDRQVKIRGFRIELGDIQSALSALPGVASQAVIARADASGEQRLLAYVVPQDPARPPELEALRAALTKLLPDYMVPAHFALLDALPLTPSGKLDERALPEPQLDAATEFEAPRSESERLLASLWEAVLHTTPVGRRDRFFDLGGDSIRSLQLVARAREAGFRLSSHAIFEHPTLEQQALCLEPLQTSTLVPRPSPLGPQPNGLLPIQHWFFEQALPEPHHFNQAVFLKAHGLLDFDILVDAVQALSAAHQALHSHFLPQSHAFLLHVDDAHSLRSVTVEAFDLLPDQDLRSQAQLLADRLHASLHLQHGPLLRFCLLRGAEDQNDRLLILGHHLLLDGVSWRILLEDLLVAYSALQQGSTPSLLPELTTPSEFAAFLHSLPQRPGAPLLLARDYWRNQQAKRSDALSPWLADSSRPGLEGNTLTLRYSLPPDLTADLLLRALNTYRCRINDLLLAALALAAHRAFGLHSLALDLEAHGREDIHHSLDLSRSIGWFTTLAPLSLDLRQPHDLQALLKDVKEQLRAIPQHGLGFGILRYLDAQPLESAPRSALCFNYLGQLDTPPRRPPLTR